MLNNMKTLIAARLYNKSYASPIAVTTLSGSNSSFYINSNYLYLIEDSLKRFCSGSAMNGYGFRFGTSDAPVEESDYNLKGEWITAADISVSVPSSIAITSTSDFIGFVTSYTILAKNQVTIKEMLVTCTSKSDFSDDNSWAIDRVVFDVPIILSPGESKTITYKMKIG